MTTEKVTFAQAAKVLNLHTNTLKNWQKAGKLPTAEKRKIKGVVTWIVDLDEVTTITQQGYTIIDEEAHKQPRQEDIKEDEQAYTEPPTQANQAQQLQPNIEATLTIFRESVVAPLTVLIKEQGNQIAELSNQNGRLEERVKTLEAQLEASQVAHPVQPDPKPLETVNTTPKAENAPEPPKKRRWWQF